MRNPSACGLSLQAYPRVLLLKRCVAADLSERPESKLVRDVKSYENEAR